MILPYEERRAMMKQALILLLVFFLASFAQAKTVEYNLDIAYKDVNFTGKTVKAMSVGGSIPGPTLRFVDGDIARIHVHNKMDVESSIHWHGLLVPPNMDGVPNLTYPPIKPRSTFTYEFPIRQSGTYWYHSHTGLQEQRGVYGSIVIEPSKNKYQYNHDYVVMLSDWTDEAPQKIMKTLKRGSEWYSLQKGSAQSILGAVKSGRLGDYFKRELQRMPPMDIADIAYDRFLINGQVESSLNAEPGDMLRLRIINGSASTFFYVEFSGGEMTIISADGQLVQPLKKKRILIGVAETYDVLVKVPKDGAYEFRSTAQDGSSFASAWIGQGKKYPATNVLNADLYQTMGGFNLKQIFALTPAGAMGMNSKDVKAGKFDQPGMNMDMSSMDMGSMNITKYSGHQMDQDKEEVKGNSMEPMEHDFGHSQPMNMKSQKIEYAQKDPSEKKYGHDFRFLAADISSSDNLVADGMGPERPWVPYADLRALTRTDFSENKSTREIRLTLDGDMERYVWFLNSKPLSESDMIKIKEGEMVRFIMINRTMMHHPMHLHGHFFRVVNGQGEYSPLKHTVDVEPMSTTVIEFDANEVGDWFFHCHLLYHMASGMARVVHYEDYQPDVEVLAVRSKLKHNNWYYFGNGDFLSNMTQGKIVASNYRNILTAQWEYGWQDVEENEWESTITWGRYYNRFFTVFAGVDILGEGDYEKNTRAVGGIRYLLPLNVESTLWADSDGGARVALDKELMLTPRLALVGEVEYDTHTKWEGQTGMIYQINKDFSVKALWHTDFGIGGGLNIYF